jgi:fucose 4-O-acetylase-like acetyltransferase
MPDISKNNHISIAKALGIILMVVGHSGGPTIVNNFIYLFHMPLFLVCSGYFFKEITDRSRLLHFYQKRIKGLYFPYFKWSILFLLLHNIFRYLNITQSKIYQLEDYLKQFAKLVAMTDYELLIRPFWFIKELLLASLFVATISFVCNRQFEKYNAEILLIIALILSFLTKYISPIPIIGDSSVLCLSIAYYYSGIILNKYKHYIHISYVTLLLTFVIVFIGSIFYEGIIDMRFTKTSNLFLYYVLSIFGIIFIICLATKLDQLKGFSFFYYIGNHTMPILALNILALKIGNLIKIWYYDLPIDSLASYTVIYDNNALFWILYSIIGVSIPLLIDFTHIKYCRKKKNKTFFY